MMGALAPFSYLVRNETRYQPLQWGTKRDSTWDHISKFELGLNKCCGGKRPSFFSASFYEKDSLIRQTPIFPISQHKLERLSMSKFSPLSSLISVSKARAHSSYAPIVSPSKSKLASVMKKKSFYIRFWPALNIVRIRDDLKSEEASWKLGIYRELYL